jgi:hypothetical protein
MIRRSAFYFVVAIFLSCTEKETANDKYPNIPFFPGSSNAKYIFEKKPFRGSVRLENFIVEEDYESSSENVVLFDLSTAKLKEVRVKGNVQYIDRLEGSIISRINDSTFLRYPAPAFASEIVPFKKYYSVVDDSVKKIRPLLDFRSIRTTGVNESFPCKTEFPDRLYYLIRERTGSFIVDSRAMNSDLQECDFVLDSPFPESFLTAFDNVVLGYSFSGSNHIAFGIEANRLHYYRIVLGQDTISFKNSSEYFQLYQMRGQNPVIIDGYDSLYELKLE